MTFSYEEDNEMVYALFRYKALINSDGCEDNEIMKLGGIQTCSGK